MTGGTSGIGLEAARALLKDGHALEIGVRRPETAPADIRRLATLHQLDLADLRSVTAFAECITPGADALLFNAGIQVTSDQRSAQGLERTFATNHLAHLLLLGHLARDLAPGGRIVLTASGVHNADEKTGIPPPRHAEARLLAFPETDSARDPQPGVAGRRAYAASKLCNVMTGRELAKRLSSTRPDIAAATFDPGFNPGTGLARDYGAIADLLFKTVLPLVIHGENVTSPPRSGRALAALVADAAYAAARGNYFSMRNHTLQPREPSALARDAAACAKLWEESQALLAEAGFQLRS